MPVIALMSNSLLTCFFFSFSLPCCFFFQTLKNCLMKNMQWEASDEGKKMKMTVQAWEKKRIMATKLNDERNTENKEVEGWSPTRSLMEQWSEPGSVSQGNTIKRHTDWVTSITGRAQLNAAAKCVSGLHWSGCGECYPGIKPSTVSLYHDHKPSLKLFTNAMFRPSNQTTSSLLWISSKLVPTSRIRMLLSVWQKYLTVSHTTF